MNDNNEHKPSLLRELTISLVAAAIIAAVAYAYAQGWSIGP
jgi:hypothetical protein